MGLLTFKASSRTRVMTISRNWLPSVLYRTIREVATSQTKTYDARDRVGVNIDVFAWDNTENRTHENDNVSDDSVNLYCTMNVATSCSHEE